MPLSDSEKTNVRHHCGYPTGTFGGVGGQSGQLYSQFGSLETRMNALNSAELVIVRRYLGTLQNLELAVPRSGDNLDTDQASVWTRNRTEAQDRLALFDEWRRRLCAFMGVRPGPFFPTKSARITV